MSQVRLADGSRLIVKLNHTHTVSDLRTYISTARWEMHNKVSDSGPCVYNYTSNIVFMLFNALHFVFNSYIN